MAKKHTGGWFGDSEAHAIAGAKGGNKVSQDREHMAEIGRKGGRSRAADREAMSEIGRKGGLTAQDNKRLKEYYEDYSKEI